MSFYYLGHTSAFYPTKSQFFRSFVPQKAGCLIVESDLHVPDKSGFPQHTYHAKFNQPKPLLSLAGATFSISKLRYLSRFFQMGPPNRYLPGGLLKEL